MLMRVHGLANGAVFLGNQCWRDFEFSDFGIERIKNRCLDLGADGGGVLAANLFTNSGFQGSDVFHAEG